MGKEFTEEDMRAFANKFFRGGYAGFLKRLDEYKERMKKEIQEKINEYYSMNRFEPLDDYVIVEVPKEAEKTTESGLVVAKGSGETSSKPKSGTVIAVGPGTFDYGVLEPMRIAIGDKIIFENYAANALALTPEEEQADVQYFAVSQSSVLAKVRE